jgi:predicted DsbA family dithiol-disulfide isomerase
MTSSALSIDFVSDVSCPWCAIGLQSLDQALARLPAEVAVALRFQPFELNPQMGAAGQDIGEHLQEKYGVTPEQVRQTHDAIAARGAALGFVFGNARNRIYNTFDAHRLLHWAGACGAPGAQKALKQALFKAYFTDGLNPSDHEVLVRLAVDAGLDGAQARQVLDSGAHAEEVRAQAQFWQANGIRSVPSVIVNGRHLIQGGQPPEVFEQALRQILAETA